MLSYKTGMTKITQGFSAKYRALTPKYINNSQASEADPPSHGWPQRLVLVGDYEQPTLRYKCTFVNEASVGVSASVTFIITYMHYSSYYYSRLTLFLTV